LGQTTNAKAAHPTEEEFRDKVVEVASHLGRLTSETWEFEHEPNGWQYWSHLKGPQGMVLNLSASSREPGRITVGGDYPQDCDGQERPMRHDKPVPAVTVSFAKTPAQIASDIKRRFLDAYRVRHADGTHARNREVAKRLRNALGANRGTDKPFTVERYESPRDHVYLPGPEAVVNWDGTVELKVDHLPVDLADKILSLIAAHLDAATARTEEDANAE
jgi:hypothetical protein